MIELDTVTGRNLEEALKVGLVSGLSFNPVYTEAKPLETYVPQHLTRAEKARRWFTINRNKEN